MIIGIGTDIVDIDRIKKLYKKNGDAFLNRIFTKSEIADAGKYESKKKFYAHFAKRFAAKEAFAKALGSGIGEDIKFTDIEISNSSAGQPVIHIKGKGLSLLNKMLPGKTKAKIDLSLSDDHPYAIAFVIISAN